MSSSIIPLLRVILVDYHEQEHDISLESRAKAVLRHVRECLRSGFSVELTEDSVIDSFAMQDCHILEFRVVLWPIFDGCPEWQGWPEQAESS